MSILDTLGFIAGHPLNRHRRARALMGFVKWQLGSRLMPGPVVYGWINGSRFIVRRGESSLTGNVYCGLQEFEDMAYLLHVLTPEDLFVDIGANVGSYTVLACAAKGAKGVCFEPVPSTFERLVDNIRLNEISERVEARNVGLSDEEGELIFTSDQDSTNHVVGNDEESPESISVKVSRLDTILEGRAPTMVKIDVEGFEQPVIAGAKATLENPALHSVVMELNGSGARYGFNEDQIVETMRDFGFATFSYEPFSRRLEPLEEKKSTSGNTLFVRNQDAVRAKLQSAPRILVGDVRL